MSITYLNITSTNSIVKIMIPLAMSASVIIMPISIEENVDHEIASDLISAQAVNLSSTEDFSKKTGFLSLLGAGKGSFSSPEEADAFIRKERDKWI